MRNETTVDVDAPAEVLWAVVKDVESWPKLTESMTFVERLDGGPLREGMRVKVNQPKLPPATWKVTELVENERFVWRARGPGFTTTASHEVPCTLITNRRLPPPMASARSMWTARLSASFLPAASSGCSGPRMVSERATGRMGR